MTIKKGAEAPDHNEDRSIEGSETVLDQVLDPEVKDQTRRRQYSAAYKLRILEELDHVASPAKSEITPGTTVVNDLGLEQSDDRLGQRVVVRVAYAADRRLDASLLQALSVTNREILAAPVAMMNHALGVGASPRAPVRAHP